MMSVIVLLTLFCCEMSGSGRRGGGRSCETGRQSLSVLPVVVVVVVVVVVSVIY